MKCGTKNEHIYKQVFNGYKYSIICSVLQWGFCEALTREYKA
jgi:hypothetical protein